MIGLLIISNSLSFYALQQERATVTVKDGLSSEDPHQVIEQRDKDIEALKHNIEQLENELASKDPTVCYDITNAVLEDKHMVFSINGTFFLKMTNSTISSSTIDVNGTKKEIGMWFINSNSNTIRDSTMSFSTTSDAGIAD